MKPLNLDNNEVGFTTGVFDLFHYGHVRFLQLARNNCDYLIVGIHTDEAILKYKQTKTVMTLEERTSVIAACRYVNEVIIIPTQAELTEFFYISLGIDIQFQGDDNDDYSLPKTMGIFTIIPYTEGISTTKIKERIKK